MDLSMWQALELIYPQLSDTKKIFVFGCNADCMVLLNDNQLPSFFHNSSMIRLYYPEFSLPNVEQESRLYRDKHIMECSADYKSHVVLSTEYRPFSFCFDMPDERNEGPPYLCAVPNIYKVACGKQHTVIIKLTGEISIHDTIEDILIKNHWVPWYETFMQETVGGLLDDVMAEEVACGFGFTVVVDCDGVVYSWGNNHKGQLGIGTIVNEKLPVVVPIGTTITNVACGTSHVLALSDTGDLYTWGSNWIGELGYDCETNFCNKPKMLISGVSEISAVHNSRLSAAKIGSNVYIWGDVNGYRFCSPTLTVYTDINVPFALLSIRAITPKLTILQSPLAGTMKKNLKDCFNDKESCDVKFEVGDRFIYAHQHVLRLRCNHFINLFQKNVTDESDGYKMIKIEDCSYEEYKTFLKYLYTDEVEEDMSIDLIAGLYKLSVNYNQINIQHICRILFIGEISVETVGQCFEIATEIKDKELIDACRSFAVYNKTAIMQSRWFSECEDFPFDFMLAVIQYQINHL